MKKYLLTLVLTIASIVSTKAQDIFVFEKDTVNNKYDSTLVVSCKLHEGDCLYVQVYGYESKGVRAEMDTVVLLEYKIKNNTNRVKIGFVTKDEVSWEVVYYIIDYRIFYKGEFCYDYACDCYRYMRVNKGSHIRFTRPEENEGNYEWAFYNQKTGVHTLSY